MMLSFDQVREGLDVYDAADDKIGQVDEIYAPAAGETAPTDAWTMRVATGPLGLGYVEYHIPFSAIASVTDERVQLNAARDQLPMLHRRENLVYPADQPDRSTTTTEHHPGEDKPT
jgi:hypothetical protein